MRLLTADIIGVARITRRPPYPARIRLAALALSRWVFGAWFGFEEGQQTATLRLGPTTSAIAHSSAPQGYAQVLTDDGWGVSFLLTRIGTRPTVSPSAPLHLHGLPVGTYTIVVAGSSAAFVASAGESAEVELE